ncbi:MAG TPA: DUF6495 family protein [Flavobacteriaceae bacterium]|nr:DUF6495 family protein [Flavobacteriaceae bacterium]HEX5743700.1 DUF6495 family protein [Flavobacteriaceae bacterium]
MKYTLLTKEQFEHLHHEFAVFLASQQIDGKEWEKIKAEKPKVALEEMQLFSEVVWEDVLSKVHYLEHFSNQHLNLFKCEAHKIYRIYIKINYAEIDVTTNQGLDWIINHLKDEKVEIFSGSKVYESERNEEIFKLIEKGSVITNGKLYDIINQLIA